MQDFNNIRIIGIDHGYGNIKTANTVTPTGVIVSDTGPTFDGNVLFYNGKYYRFGEGHKSFISDKTEDEDFYAATLMAIARELSREGLTKADVHIAAGLPLTWVRKQREEFRSYLMQNKTAEFRFNGKDYKIRFVGCSIYPQGYPAVISKISDFDGTNLLVDIGNGTMNILYISNRKPIESRCWTEKAGVNQCMIAAKNAVLDNFGIKIDDSVIETVIRKRTADIAKPYLNCILRTVNQYVNNIFAILRNYEYNPDLVRLYVIGGGGCLIKNFGNYDKERVTIIDDICATAKGYEYIAYSSLRRKEHQ